MTGIAQHKGIIKMDVTGTATVTTDVSAAGTGFSVKPSKSIGKHFTLGADWQQITEGGLGLTVSIMCEISKTITSLYYYLLLWSTAAAAGANRTMEFDTPDAQTGSLTITGEFYIEAADNLMNVAAGKGDAQIATFTVHSDGVPTIGVHA
jgi:hypothetical protein